MNWGAAINEAWNAASGSVREAALNSVSSIQEAAAALRHAAALAAQAAARVADFSGRATEDVAVAVARASFALADKGMEASPIVGRAYIVAKKILSPSQTPRKAMIEPCPTSIAGKLKRLERRKALIDLGRNRRSTPEQKAAAERLARNNDAVELGKLSGDTYLQYQKPARNSPPLGWAAMNVADLKTTGIDPKLVADSKAVIYQTPADWPGGQKTVLAFRGTVPSEAEDLQTNLKQALGEETMQYEAAKELGRNVAKKFGASVLVTGHSLGGGKAQAAGTRGSLKGTMFNSAGLNANTVDGALPDAGLFTQFRAPGDPLTGIQNSAGMQSGAGLASAIAMPFGAGASAGNFLTQRLGMPSLSPDMADGAIEGATAFPRALGNLVTQGNLMPPAIGKVIEAPSLDNEGKPTPATDLLGQHSVENLVNGIEREKSEDVATLQTTL